MPPSLLVLLVLHATAVAPDAAEAKKPRIFVAEVTGQGVPPEQASPFTDAVVAALQVRSLFEVVSARDVQTALGAERQKSLMGLCETDAAACSHEASTALLARFVLSGQLARIGSAWQLTLQLVDTTKGQSVSRSTKLASDVQTLRDLVPWAAAEATGSPLPPPPSRVLPVTLAAAGGATMLAGGAVALLAASRVQQLNDELCPGGVPLDGRCGGATLRDRAFYVQQDQALRAQSWLGAGLVVAGAALLGAGLWLLPPADAMGRGGVALVPTGPGLAVVGGF